MALIKVLSDLLGVILWPAIVLYVLVRFRVPLNDFFSNLGEASFKAPGIEATVRRKQVEAAAALGAAMAALPARSGLDVEPAGSDAGRERLPGPAASERDVLPESGAFGVPVSAIPRAAAESVVGTVTSTSLRRVEGSTVLWVDDRPQNNRYERQALEALGIGFVLSTSTEDALARTQHQSFDAIVSDMGRPPDPRAGYTLLDALRKRGDYPPFIIYAGSRSPEHIAEAKRRGALGCTNQPQELFELVLEAVRSRRTAQR